MFSEKEVPKKSSLDTVVCEGLSTDLKESGEAGETQVKWSTKQFTVLLKNFIGEQKANIISGFGKFMRKSILFVDFHSLIYLFVNFRNLGS